ncbi:DUF922 domain-containing Zn-dependent protease [Geminocystis sp. CENA526]|uniref:DUF922 domain-containing Zn-dependent protease n=1 Tax=Geminocystis sp. CENA526 TaxID=1355871 RepID=UPI003D6EB551
MTVFLTIILNLIAFAKPAINISTNYYNVRGKTVPEIAQSLYNDSPIIYQGKKYHAYTSWNVKWNFNWYQYPRYCQITSVKTTVDVKYTLPKLITYASLSSAVKQKWDRYYKALIYHEEGHKNFGVNSALNIEKSILNMGKRNSCPQLEKDANIIANNVIKRSIEQEKEYDRITNHGATQGAVFP